MISKFLVIFISGCLSEIAYAPLKHRIKPKMKTCTAEQNFGDGGRIVGKRAKPAKKGSWPWLVRIEIYEYRGGAPAICGGIIIGDDVILTGNIGCALALYFN